MTEYEMYAAQLSDLILILENIIGGYCLYLLAKPFMKKKRKALLSGAAYFFAMLALYGVPMHFTSLGAHGLGVFAAFCVMCLAERGNGVQKAFVALTFFPLYWMACAASSILQDKLYSAALKTDYMAAHPDMWFVLYVVMCLFGLLCEFLFMAAGIRSILRNCRHLHTELSPKALLLLAVPSVMGLLGVESMWHYRNSYIAETGKISDVHDWLAVLYCAAAVAAIVVVIVLHGSIMEQREEKLQNELLAMQLASIRQHIKQVEKLYQNIRSIRHDMTNHIVTLERLYAGNKTEEANAYGAELKVALVEAAGRIHSGNPVTDVILQEIQNEAEKRKLCFTMDFHYPAGSAVNAFDISIILHNALQNALENAEGSQAPYISIRSYRRNNAYMIEISNSFTGELQWDAGKELPVTSKKKAEGHGYGLVNIRRVARKYSGDIDIALQDGAFCLSILLMLE